MGATQEVQSGTEFSDSGEEEAHFISPTFCKLFIKFLDVFAWGRRSVVRIEKKNRKTMKTFWTFVPSTRILGNHLIFAMIVALFCDTFGAI